MKTGKNERVKMKIILDGMGGDNAPQSIIEGAVEASKLLPHEICILGPEGLISKELSKHSYDKRKITVVNCTEVISNNDAPVKAIRRMTDSTIVKGLNMVNAGDGDCFISAGSTGALLVGGLFILGRIQGIDRPAIATVYPVVGKEAGLLLDCGANTECKPNNLLEFALMGSVYMEKVLKRKNPNVGLVNIGVEEKKGSILYKNAHELLSKSSLNFVGNVEARDIPQGAADVFVCDGFTGNIILKLTEGLAGSLFSEIKRRFSDGLKAKLGAGLLRKKITGFKAEFDYTEYGGAPILGVKKPLIKMHGSSNAKAVVSGIMMAIPYVEEDVVGKIESSCLEAIALEIADAD